MKTVLHLIQSRLPTQTPAGTLSSPFCVTAARQQRIYETGSPASAMARGSAAPRNPDACWHQAQGTGTPPLPALASHGASSRSAPSSHAFPHLSRAEPDLRVISASKSKSGSMAVSFSTRVSKTASMGWLCPAEPSLLCCSIDPFNPKSVGAEHLLQHPKPIEPYGMGDFLLPSPTCCFPALKKAFFSLHA